MPETIKLGVTSQDTTVSYVSLYKHLENISLVNEESFRKVFDEVQFKEEVGYEYNSLPIYVGWEYIPVVVDGLIEIKILKLEQGNGIAIILPEHVAATYKALEEDITKLDTYNKNLDLVGDLYGLDEKDPELLDLIKKLYVNVGDRAEAYRLTAEGENLQDTAQDTKDDAGMGFGDDSLGLGAPGENRSFGDIPKADTPVEEAPEIVANEEAYKRFKKDTKSLSMLQNKLYNKVPLVIREHITTKYVADEKILLVNVNNKAIYETFNTLPKHARAQITEIGEFLRLNENTQLVDSFKYLEGRIFVMAENSHSNIWMVKNEEIKTFNEKRDKTLYISKKDAIIELERSNIRQENRRFVPRDKEGNTVFSVR